MILRCGVGIGSAIVWCFSFLVSVSAEAAGVQLVPGLAFEGTNLGQAGFIPPDAMGAVGTDHVVEMVNGRFSVYRKTDGVQLLGQSLDEFWEDAGVTPTNFSFDPRILYDVSEDRWYAVSVENSNQPNRFLVAVSDGPDPGAGWTGFGIASDPTNQTWADFPTLGMNDDSVYVAGGMFEFGAAAANETHLLVIPKADLLAPMPSVAQATLIEDLPVSATGLSAQPVVDFDGGGPGILLGEFSAAGFVVRNDITGPPGAPALVGPQIIPVDTTVGLQNPLGPQPGPKMDIDSGTAVFSANVIKRNGSVWTVTTVNENGRAALRWREIDAVTSAVLQTGVISDPDLSFYYGSIAVNDAGEVVIGMSGSSETTFVGAYAVAGASLGGVTSFGPVQLLRAGVSDYEVVRSGRNRWGDYSATVPDPSSPHAFWTFQEYVRDTDEWGIQISQIFVVPEPGAAFLIAWGVSVLAVRRSRVWR